MSDQMTDEAIMMSWYRYSADQPGSVDSLLRQLRYLQGKSLEEQKTEFGASDQEFTRLRGLKLPRPQFFTSDAQRIAAACHLTYPLAFVQALLLARNLVSQPLEYATSQSYEAAFDDIDDLDEVPKDEKNR